MVKVTVDPLTRIEGHMRISAEVNEGKIEKVQSSGMLFRGFERILQGRDPKDAPIFVQRICGVCPISHGLTSLNALDSLYGVAESVPQNALAVRNFIQGLNTIASAATHIYILFGPDLANPRYKEVLTSQHLGFKHGASIWKELVGRFAPISYKINGEQIPVGSSYINVIPEKKRLQEAISLFTGKMPHTSIFYPGGVTCNPGISEIIQASDILLKVLDFVEKYTLGVPLDVWIENTVNVSPEFAFNFLKNHISSLVENSNGDYSRENGFKDVEFYATFGSKLICDLFDLPSLAHDTIGGYQNLDTIKFLSYGAYYDSSKDGYNPLSPKGERHFTSGLCKISGSKNNLYLDYESLDTSKITESIKCSFYEDQTVSRTPFEGTTNPISDPEKIYYEGSLDSKYSWLKAPRYDGIPCEVGPFSRMLVSKDPLITGIANEFLKLGYSPANVFTRMIARMHEITRIASKLLYWLDDIDPSRPYAVSVNPNVAKNHQGIGLWEAPRGSLGNWVTTDSNGKIKNYQSIVPSTWNLGPRDENGIPSPVEQALEGNCISGMNNVLGANYENPIAILHVGRSYDPCIACAIHTIDLSGSNLPKEYKLF